jgi:flagellar protein FlaI
MKECPYDLKREGKRILTLDCSECLYGGSLSDNTCIKRIFPILKKERVDSLIFRKKNYTEIYDERRTYLLLEVIDITTDLLEEKIWDKLDWKYDPNLGKKYREFLRNLPEEFLLDPVKTYKSLVALIKQHSDKIGKESQGATYEEGIMSYLSILEEVMEKIEKSKLIRSCEEGASNELLRPLIQPTFLFFHLSMDLPENARLVEKYMVSGAEVRIYDLDGHHYYSLNPPELWFHPDDIDLVSRLKDFVTSEYSLDVVDPASARDYFRKKAIENLPNFGEIPKERAQRLTEIFARYTAGYGLLEILFSDPHISDLYIDSPPGLTPMYLEHEKYGTCNTNVYSTKEGLERLSSKFRAVGERPFDDGNPFLDMQLEELGVRVAGIRQPSTFEGTAYAFRKHRGKPWTLAQFVRKGMFSARTAAILSLLIAAERSILVTGARGSGKTSLLSSLLAEVDQRDRIILLEDTPEIPSNSLKRHGWKIEHLRNRPALSKNGHEVSPAENLRAALRLGESVLVLGEVRGEEARALFEAMRVGAAGNAVLGTIHGSSPYDTWDRVTNDLGVPHTSFKAVDVIISLSYRDDKNLKKRHLNRVTEVRKKWDRDPEMEGAFFDLVKFNEETKQEESNLKDSEVIKRICQRMGRSYNDLENLLRDRERMIREIIHNSEENEGLLEIEHIIKFNKKYRELSLNSDSPYQEWRKWFEEYLDKMGIGRKEHLSDIVKSRIGDIPPGEIDEKRGILLNNIQGIKNELLL